MRWLWRKRSSRTIGFTVFLVINLILLVGYLWSRGGQTVHLRVEARGDQFAAYIDGQLRAKGEFDARTRGGLVLILGDPEDIPSLPTPRGIDFVRVTDLTTGRLLFQDDFSSGYRREWRIDQPQLVSSDDGVLSAASRV